MFKITSRASKRYSVKYVDNHFELIGRLILEFSGKNTRATVFKPSYIFENSKISGIYEHRFQDEAFVSYEDINHSFNAIEIIINNLLPDWKVALSSIYGIYLISDKKSGKHYIGSACGGAGIWGRWHNYVIIFNQGGGYWQGVIMEKQITNQGAWPQPKLIHDLKRIKWRNHH